MAKNKTVTKKNTYGKGEMFGYLTGMFGQNLIYQVIAAGLVSYYLGSVLYIPAAAVSAIIFIARIWDAVNDPMMGTIVDKTHTRWGKCRPYLIFFPVIIGIMTVACFLNGRYTDPGANKILIVGWAAASYILWGMLFTVCDIPLWGITSLMTEDSNDRSKILGLARIAAIVGGIGTVITFIPDMFTHLFQGKYDAMIGVVEGYDQMMANDDAKRAAWILTVIGFTVIGTLFFQIAGIVTRERVPGDKADKRGIIENFKIMWACKPFRQILISGVLRSPLQLLMILAMPLAMYYYLDNDTNNIANGGDSLLLLKIGLIAIAVFGAQFVASAITPNLVKKFENKKLYNFFTVAGAVPYALIFVGYKLWGGNLTTLSGSIFLAVCIAFAAASMGAINVMQSIMIADCVDYEEYHKGYRPDGVFFSGQSFLTKLSGGIAALIQGIVYSAVKFSGNNLQAINDALKTTNVHFYELDGGKYAAAMFFLISIPVAVGMLLSALPMRNYAMTDAEHTEMLEALVAKREAAKEEKE